MIPNLPSQQKIFGLDFMRVLAILLVLAAHCLWIFEEHQSFLTKAISFSGFMGVELFFVLSGYLIGGGMYRIFCDSDFNFQKVRRFLKRRSLRILPSYYLILTINILLAFLLGMSVEAEWKYYFFLQNFKDPMLPFFPESWSMPIKEIPYFIIPLLLLPIGGIFRGANRTVVFTLVIFLLYLSAIFLKLQYHWHCGSSQTGLQWNGGLRSVFCFRYDAVLTGVLFYIFREKSRSFWNRQKIPMLWLGIALFFASAYLIGFAGWSVKTHPFFWNVLFLPVLSLASALSLPYFAQWENASALLDRPVTFVGNISYSIYLVHYSLVLWLMKHYFPTAGLSVPMLFFYMFAYIAITFLLSWALYIFFERPVLRWRMQITKYGKG